MSGGSTKTASWRTREKIGYVLSGDAISAHEADDDRIGQHLEHGQFTIDERRLCRRANWRSKIHPHERASIHSGCLKLPCGFEAKTAIEAFLPET
jgi:hypothetical protein